MELQTTDYFRIIADLCLINDNAIHRVDCATKLANIVQKILNIPEDYEVAVAVLSVLFCHSRLKNKFSYNRLSLKLGLLEITELKEDIIFLLNNHYIEIGKSAENIEWIMIKSKLYLQLYNDMKQENRKLFMLVADKKLNEKQLKYFKLHLFNDGLDIGHLFFMCVSCRQLEAAKAIISFGYDMNKEYEQMGYELFICANYDSSKFCIDFYIQQGLKITDTLLKEMMECANDNSEEFEIENTVKLIEELKQNMVN